MEQRRDRGTYGHLGEPREGVHLQVPEEARREQPQGAGPFSALVGKRRQIHSAPVGPVAGACAIRLRRRSPGEPFSPSPASASPWGRPPRKQFVGASPGRDPPQTCYNVTDPSVGLASTADESSFKCYMGDTGLLVSQVFADSAETPHEVYRDILLGKLQINEGMLTENVVAQQLTCDGRGLYFYSKRDDGDRSSTMEIDFLIAAGYDDAAGRLRVSPVEDKSTKRYSTRSLDKFRDKFGGRVGTRYVLHPRPLVIDGDDLVRLPLYASMSLASGHVDVAVDFMDEYVDVFEELAK
ncbi:DUF4143 domain-containing protein [Collinsella tanakaei]|nr:DUF4143 domain-containing protein [Collinsella tanakaei]